MNSRYTQLKDTNSRRSELYKPVFYRLNNAEDKRNFDLLLESDTVFLFDEIYDQLKELLKSRNPWATLGPADYKQMIDKHLNGGDPDEYGVWVYYPWSGRVVHMLDELEFIELRTSANKNKITIPERDLLASKKVGVIGLSVGQSVSLTLAMERGCGELRLADFDTLELNNLNRIRTGVHNLGLLKAYSVAREIAELDPFFKVVCYTEGITDDNIDDFFLKGGKLDAVIDECDGVNIKILCRIKAKELHVPVLMEASDRGTLDIERFDLHPGMPIMHGWLEHLTLDLEVLKNLKTNEEKVPYMLPISGLDTLSSRMKASMVEIRSTISTWPQLATAVTLGGAITADTCRRIFLDQFTDSGRYFIDMEQLVPDTRPKENFALHVASPLSDEMMKDMAGSVAGQLAKAEFLPAPADVVDLVSAAIMAPSAGNSQPWKWYYSNGYLYLFFEDTGIVSFGDYKGGASSIAHGAAIENLSLVANSKGMDVIVSLFPLNNESRLVAAIRFTKVTTAGTSELANYIDKRNTNRNVGTKKEIDPDILTALQASVRFVPGAELILKTSTEDISALSDIVGPADRLRLLHPASHAEFFQKELRWTDEDAQKSKDGISINALGISPPEELALKMIRSQEVVNLITQWRAGQALQYTSRKALGTASAIGLITLPGSAAVDHVRLGRAMQRMWLTATMHGVAIQPLMTPVFCFERLVRGGGDGMSEDMKATFRELYDRFSSLFPGTKEMGSLFLFKLSLSEVHSVRSCRKPVSDVLVIAG